MAFESSYTQKKKKKSGFEASSKMSVDTAYVKRKRDEAEKKLSSFTQRYQDYFNTADSYLSRKNWDMTAPSYEDADRFKAEAESLLYELNDNRRFLANGDYAPFLDKISTTDYTKLAEAIKGEADFRKQIGSAENYEKFLDQAENNRRLGIDSGTSYRSLVDKLTSGPLLQKDKEYIKGLIGSRDYILTMTADDVRAKIKADRDALKLPTATPEMQKSTSAYAFFDDYGNPVTWDEYLEILETEDFIRKVFEAERAARGDAWNRVDALSGDKLSDVNVAGYTKEDKLRLERIYRDNPQLIERLMDGGVEAAYKKTDTYFDYLEAKKQADKRREEDEAWAKANPVLATLANFATAPAQILDYAGNLISADSSELGRRKDVYNDKFTSRNQAYTEGVTGLIDESIDNDALSWLATTAYSGITSAAQSTVTTLASSAIFGPQAGPVIALATIGSQAAASSYNEAIKNGSTYGEALTFSIASGIAEAMMEKLPLDKLLKNIKTAGKGSAKEIIIRALKNTAYQGLTEGGEELGTSLIDKLADSIINGDTSSYNASINRYMQLEGMTEAEAREKASMDYLKEVAESVIGGFIGGATSGGSVEIGAGVSNIVKNKITDARAQRYIGSRISQNDNVDALIGETEGVDNQAVQKYTDKVKRAQERQNEAALKKATGRLFDALSDAKQKKAILNKKDLLQKRVHEALEGTENADKAEKVVLKALYTGLSKKTDRDLYEKVNGAKILDDIMSSEDFKAENEALSQKERAEYHRMQRLITDKSEALKRAEALNDLDYDIAADGVAKVSGKAVDIKRIETLGADTVTLSTSDGVHDASDMALPKDDAIILNGLSRMVETTGIDRDTANIIYGMWKETEGADAISFILGAEEAIRYGKINYRGALESGVNTKSLPESLRESLFKEGARMATVEAERTEAKKKKASENVAKKNGGLFAEDGVALNRDGTIDESVLTSVQKANLNGIRALAKLSPINFHIFKSRKVNGKFVATINGETVEGSPNGLYFRGTNDIWLDLNAGDFGEGTMLWTAGHEISHYIRERLPAKWKAMADYIMQEFTENDAPVDYMLEKQKAKILARESSKSMTEAEIDGAAYEELISDALTEMLTDGTVVDYLAKVKQQDRNLWQTIMDAISDLIKRWGEILGVYKGRELDVDEAKALRAIKGAREALTEMYAEAFAEANEVVLIDSASESVAPSYSERTWTESEYVQERELAAEAISEALGVGIRKAYKYIDDINSIAAIIADDRTRLDYKASLFGSSFVSNSEYGGSFDFTTLCKKRRLFTGTFTEIQKRLRNTALTPDDILKIRNMMIEKGLEATCGLCYVEGSRANMGKFAKEFIRLYERENPDGWKPDMADVNTPDGVESMRINHPEVYEKYEYFWNHYGKLSESDPALFASQQKPKLYEARKAYKGEILENFGKEEKVNDKNKNGGIRMQSFSDFEIVHLIDTMQIIMDMSRVGLAGQAYTKVPEFARAFGDTGLKINLSLIAKGVDADGKLIFDDREGMPHETAFELRRKHSKNVGTIIVAFTDEQIYAAMADPRIDFIIPFHRRQWKKGQYGAMGLPKGTKDYTYVQNEKLIKQTYHEYRGRMVKDKAKNFMPNEYWDFSKSGKENAEAYLEMCAAQNKRPKFYKFLDYAGNGKYALKKDGSTDGYWKLLIDFKMYDNDGVGSPQNAVTPDFAMDEARAMLEEYRGGHNVYPVASEVVDEFVAEYEARGKAEAVKVETKTKALRSERNTDSEGRQLSKEQIEFFKDSKVRDADGNLLVAYHGTPNDMFYEFDSSKHKSTTGVSAWGKGFYFSDEKASYYWSGEVGARNELKCYLNITNPYIVGNGAKVPKALKDYILSTDVYKESNTYRKNYLGENASRWYDFLRFSVTEDNPNAILQRLGYDGIIVGDNVEIVIFNSNQAKLTSNKNPTSNPDIRYSERKAVPSTEDLGLTKELEAENKKLHSDVERLRELVRLQSKQTHGAKFTKTSVEAAASRLMKTFGISRGKEELAKMLNKFYGYIASSENLDWDDIDREAMNIVTFAQNSITRKPVRNSYAQEVLNTVRRPKITLTDAQKAEAAALYGSYNAFRKHFMGSLNFVNEGGVPLDSVWNEWAEAYPSEFVYDISEGDMISSLAETVDTLKNAYDVEVNINEMMQDREWVQAIYNSYWDVSTLYTVADRYERDINLLKAKHRNAMKEIREKRDSDMAEYKAKSRATLKAVRKKRDSDMAEYKAKSRATLKAVREKRDSNMAAYKARIQEMREKASERRKHSAATKQLYKLVTETADWITKPKKGQQKVPDIIKEPYAEFLEAINLSSDRLLKGGAATQRDSRLGAKMTALADVISRIQKKQDPSAQETSTGTKAEIDLEGYLDLPSDFVEEIRGIASAIEKAIEESSSIVQNPVALMAAEDVKNISKLIRGLNHAIRNLNTLYSNKRFENARALGEETVSHLDELGKIKGTTGIGNFIKWDNALPFYAFKRFGKGGRSVFEELMDAQDKLAFLARDILDFKKKTWDDKEANAWSKDSRTVTLPSGASVVMTTADAMSIYCLSKREQARPHLIEGGISVVGQSKLGKKAQESKAYLTEEDLAYIATKVLNDRQREVADEIQYFMSSDCAEWGNEISMKRFLTRDFTEQFYFPIETVPESRDTKDPTAQQTDLFRLLNISATKGLVKNANNRLVISNIFDVFTSHSSDMARLNAYGMAILDYMKWVNYRVKQTTEEGQRAEYGVRDAMKAAYGDQAFSYVFNLIKDINGRPGDNGDNKFLMGLVRGAKTASVGFNLRVAFLQPTAYPRAAMAVSPRSLAMGVLKLGTIPRSISRAKDHSGIALWKSFGFYDTNISKSIEEKIRGSSNFKQKLIEISMKGAEWGDAITWGALWNACEYDIAKTKKFKVGSAEFTEAVADKFREAVYSTQVVDSVLTRSQIMRSKSGQTQTVTSFMAEPTLSANLLMDAAMEWDSERRRGSWKSAFAKKGTYLIRAMGVYATTQILSSLIESFFDAFRDDDDEEFKKKYLQALKKNAISNVIPLNKLPLFTDAVDFIFSFFDLGYFSTDRMEMTVLAYSKNAIEAWSEIIAEERGGKNTTKTYYNAVYNTVRALSYMTGVSASGALRDLVAVWNYTLGSEDSTLKLRMYEQNAAAKGEAWLRATEDGKKKQADKIFDSFEDDDKAESGIKEALKNRYTSGEISAEDATEYLIDFAENKNSEKHYKEKAKELGMTVEEVKEKELQDKAFWTLDKWDFVAEGGKSEDYSKYNDLYSAVETGKKLKKTIAYYKEHGASESTLRTQITEHFKPIYQKMTKSERAKTNIKGYLVNAFKECGLPEYKASKKIDEWLEE